ncbi:MAG: outer membrane lipoprotein-sorting protein, partial [Planctomycetota bacterium]|nr:outer membrane lipoprotein-sorting protein [Planctomycetota bacterium]
DDLFRGDSSKGRMTMKISTKHWTRTLSMNFWGEGKEKSLIRILSPKKEKGTATLRAGNDIWNYLPKVRRVIKLPSSMMSASWMGSHFTNDDLVKETRMADDFDTKVSFQGEREGVEIVELTCIPKEEAVVVWGKVVIAVHKDDLTPIVSHYYDEDLDLARTMTFSELRVFGGRKLPARVSIIPSDKPAEATVITYEEIEFDLKLPDDLFTLRNLQR